MRCPRMFEMMNGHQLMRYRRRIGSMRFSGRSCLEPAMNGLSFSPSTAHAGIAGQAFEQKLYTAVLHDYHLNPQKQHDRRKHSTR